MDANLTDSSAAPPSDRLSVSESGSEPPAWVWDILAFAPLAGGAAAFLTGAAALLGAGPRYLARRRPVAALLASGGLLILAKTQLERHLSEQPSYVMERETNGLEIRLYERRVVAETFVDGSFDAAREEGFRRLAGYIFGKNEKRTKIAMTAPVNVAAGVERGERIAMTAPVNVARDHRGHVVSFNMPSDKTLVNLPTPRDRRITLRETAPTRVAVLRTNGSYRGARVEEKMHELLERVREAGLQATGAVAFAGYDAPSTLPALRRVELWVPVA